MQRSWLVRQGIFLIILLPMLACGPALTSQVTPTPTKTPKMVRTLAPLPTATIPVIIPPTATPLPVDTPTPEPTATETPVPEPTATNTPEPTATNPPPPPPPPPTDTPVPLPTDTPAAPPTPVPTAPPADTGPAVAITFSSGDTYRVDEKVKFTIVVSDPDGVGTFTWGIFAQNKSPVGLGGDKNCGNATQCELSGDFEAKLPGQFFLGVDAVDSKGNKHQEIKQLYVG